MTTPSVKQHRDEKSVCNEIYEEMMTRRYEELQLMAYGTMG
jgi:hypothetical protein